MRRLMMMALAATLLSLPASAADKTPAVADSADAAVATEDTPALTYPLQVQTTAKVLNLPLNVLLKQGEKDGTRYYRVTDPLGVYVGTGLSFGEALRAIYADYVASGAPDGMVPASVTTDSRTYGAVKSVQTSGQGHLRESRITLDGAPGQTFVLYDWAASYEGVTYSPGDYASFQHLPTAKADERLVISTDPVTIEEH